MYNRYTYCKMKITVLHTEFINAAANIISRFSMFNHSEVTRELIKMNEGDKHKVEFCKKIAEPGYEVLAKLPSKRFIKSHFPFSLLPNILDSGCKVNL